MSYFEELSLYVDEKCDFETNNVEIDPSVEEAYRSASSRTRLRDVTSPEIIIRDWRFNVMSN